ncbi:pilus assembly protein [Vulcaniibacterium tengchongense]|nr:PilC/PilY family type IV pilus protein [Vulcaniibacterium tengchongense]
MTLHPRSGRQGLALIAAAFAATLLALPVNAAVEFPQIPLQSGVLVPPNIMFTLDDSGSMQFEITPEQNKAPRGESTDSNRSPNFVFPRTSDDIYGADNLPNRVVTVVDNDWFNRFSRSPDHNASYYNPATRYLPWARWDGTLFPNANPSCALNNPVDPGKGCRNLTASLTESAIWYSYSNNGRTPGSGNGSATSATYWPARYYLMDQCTNRENPGCYTRVEIRPNRSYPKAGGRTDCAGSTCSYQEEIQNFANWYQYYRSRVLTARAGIGRAFVDQRDNVRVGFATINSGGRNIDGVNTSKIRSGVRAFDDAQKRNFFDLLYSVSISGGTPLRETAQVVGNYFRRSDSLGPWSDTPGSASAQPQVSCRANYHILMTDGYWNGNAGVSGNVDNTTGPEHVRSNTNETYRYTPRAPFSDGYSGTLADNAFYYWVNDLRPDLPNNVSVSDSNPAFWQHLVTFGVGLGLTTNVDPDDAFAAIRTGAQVTYTGVYGEGQRSGWPQPGTAPAGGDSAYNVDDLLHAAVNSRGGFFSAKEPDAFASGMKSVLARINERTASASSVATNSASILAGTKLYQAKYVSGVWTGEVVAYPVTAERGVDTSVESWRASSGIPTEVSQRKVYTWNGSSGVAFAWNNLTASQKAALGSEAIFNYLKGERSGERQNSVSGTFRDRRHLLGDIVNSSPAYVADTETLYVGANDGMLHAFSTRDGRELFAYVPGNINWGNFKTLSDPEYSHQYFVDGEIAVSTREQTPNRNILVGALGRGGKALYALDVTDPSAFSSSKVLWEFTDADLGNVLSRPVITKVETGAGQVPAVIVGNGYNSATQRAFLFVINLETGALIKKIDTKAGSATQDNGLAGPKGWDVDRDGDVDFVYAGDLLGNVWKFDLSASNANSWDVAFKQGQTVYPLFTARNASGGAQPITGGIAIGIDPSTYKRWVFFGTGRYITAGDPGDRSVQTWYGLIDDNARIGSRADLKQRKIAVVAANGDRAFEKAVPGDMAQKKGWYLDFVNPPYDPAAAVGERVVSDSYLIGSTLNVNSIVPSSDPCGVGGSGYINAVNAYTGAATEIVYFDADGNGVFDDYISHTSNGQTVRTPTGSLRTDNMVSQGTLVSDPGSTTGYIASGTSSGGVEDPGVNLSNFQGRISWREIVRD